MAIENSDDNPAEVGDNPGKEIVLITGGSGYIGSAIIHHLSDCYSGRYTLIGLDRPGPPEPDDPAHRISMDLTSEESVKTAVKEVRDRFGAQVASVIHLAAFFSFKGDPNPLYETVNVAGTARLLRRTVRVFEFDTRALADRTRKTYPRRLAAGTRLGLSTVQTRC